MQAVMLKKDQIKKSLQLISFVLLICISFSFIYWILIITVAFIFAVPVYIYKGIIKLIKETEKEKLASMYF